MSIQQKDEQLLMSALGDIIQDLRQTKGWSQSELAARTGFQRSYVCDFERGFRHISVKNLSKLAQAFEVNASVLLRRAESLVARHK
jgi:transcriptional regulator with XRE-family HTH domain